MNYQPYSKPYRTPKQLIYYLKEKNLKIDNISNAIKILEDINYFRFKSYLRPFFNKDCTKYNDNSEFSNAYELYKFDTQLRNELFLIISRIEIKLRSKLDQVVTTYTKNPFWYLDNNNFNSSNHNKLLSDLSNSFLRSTDEFIIHYKKKYVNNLNAHYKHMPPFWFIVEITTFGNIINIYNSLDKNKFINKDTNELDKLARKFGAKNIKELNNCLYLIRDIRNKCAHHSRVWNANYRSVIGFGKNDKRINIEPNNRNRIYMLFCILHIMTKSLNMDIEIKELLDNYIKKYPIFNSNIKSCGFPKNWYNDAFWK